MATAVTLRFYKLGTLPPGLYRDEAFNGLDALGVLSGSRLPLFFPANNGREPLFIYSVALSVWQFGRTTFALRLPAALFGTLTILPLYFLTRYWFDRSTATFTAFAWATTVWSIHLSRIGFRTVLLPFFLSTATCSLTIAAEKITHKKPATKWLIFAGLVYGLSFYTYLAARLSLVGLLLFVGYLWLTQRPPHLLAHSAWFVLGLLVMIAPLFVTLASMGELAGGRTGDVSILNAAINAQIEQYEGELAMMEDVLENHDQAALVWTAKYGKATVEAKMDYLKDNKASLLKLANNSTAAQAAE